MSNPEENPLDPPNGLKRKNESAVEEQELEAAIKRVALEDDNSNVNSNNVNNDSSEDIDDNFQINGGDIDDDDINDDKDSVENSEDYSNEDNYSSSNVAFGADDNVRLRMLCLVKEASQVVGPKGETISKIKNDTNTRINVSKNIRGVPERVVYFRGSCENVAKAFGQVSRVFSQAATARRNSEHIDKQHENNESLEDSNGNETKSIISNEDMDRVTKVKDEHEDVEHEDEEVEQEDENSISVTIHLLIPHHLMGYIIGKYGSRLKEIEELSAAKLSASPNQLVPSNDRILRVSGVPDAIHIAAFYIGQTTTNYRETLRNKKSIFYQPGPMYSVLGNSHKNNNPNHINNNYPVLVGGIPNQRPNQYNYMDRYNNNSNSSYRNRRSSRFPMYMMVQQPIAMNTPPTEPESSNGPMNYNNQQGTVYTTENVANATSFVPNFKIPNVRIIDTPMNTQSMAIVQQEIYIDENFVGNIIGKEGKHINSIKETTGCSIFIDNPTSEGVERRLMIKGTIMGSQAAIMLISNKIELDRANTNYNIKNHSTENQISN